MIVMDLPYLLFILRVGLHIYSCRLWKSKQIGYSPFSEESSVKDDNGHKRHWELLLAHKDRGPSNHSELKLRQSRAASPPITKSILQGDTSSYKEPNRDVQSPPSIKHNVKAIDISKSEYCQRMLMQLLQFLTLLNSLIILKCLL